MIDTWSMAYSCLFCVVGVACNLHRHHHDCLSLGWSSASDGAEEVFCNPTNKLKTENVDIDPERL